MANYSSTAYRFAIGRIPQTNFLTPTAPAANAFVEQVLANPALINVQANANTNKGQTTGNRFATERWVDRWTSAASFEFWLTSQNIGRYLYAAFGGYSVAPVSGSTGAFKHTFTPLDVNTSLQLPSYSVVQQVAPAAPGINGLLPSMVCSALSITSDSTNRVNANASWVGSGDENPASGVDWATNVTSTQGTQNNFYNTNSKILVSADNNGGAGFTTCDMKKWNFGIQNSFADGDYGCPRFKVAGNPESGALRSFLLLQDTTFDYGFTLRLRPTDPAYSMLLNQTPTQIVNSLIGKQIGATVSNHQLDITMALAYYNAERGFEDNLATIEIKPDLLYSNSANSVVKVELTNDISSYAT